MTDITIKVATDMKRGEGGMSLDLTMDGEDVGYGTVVANGERKHKGWPRTAAKVVSRRNQNCCGLDGSSRAFGGEWDTVAGVGSVASRVEISEPVRIYIVLNSLPNRHGSLEVSTIVSMPNLSIR